MALRPRFAGSRGRGPDASTGGRRSLGPGRMRVVGWTLALVCVVTIALLAVLLIRWVRQGPQPPYLGGTPPAQLGERASPKPANLLRLAGSGSNLPLTRALADAFTGTRPWLRVRVHESIGSGGGARAAADRAIELGLISRPLKPHEYELGLDTIPYARVAVVFAANPSVPVRGLTRSMVLDLYSGRQTHWSDGSPVIVLQREPGDSSHLAAHTVIPGFAEVDEAAWATRRWRVLYSDRAMQEALLSTPGSVGLFDRGLVAIQDLPLALLEYEGKRARLDTMRDGSYPLSKELAFVLPTDQPDPLALEFIAFVFSSEGQAVIDASGYLPLEPPPRSAFAHLREVGPPPALLENDAASTSDEPAAGSEG